LGSDPGPNSTVYSERLKSNFKTQNHKQKKEKKPKTFISRNLGRGEEACVNTYDHMDKVLKWSKKKMCHLKWRRKQPLSNTSIKNTV
jgi:hypothetical protein